MGGYLADIETRVLPLYILHAQPPVVWVAEGGGDVCVPGVGGIAHRQQVRDPPGLSMA